MAAISTPSALYPQAHLASASDYFALLKPKVMSLVIFTTFISAYIAPGNLHPFQFFVAILAIAVGAGASAALNMWYDSDIDAIMSRTRNRPIPQGKISPEAALGFGIVLSIASVITLGFATNYLAAALLGFTITFYILVYTMWLKRRTPQNIVIGGAAGAFPPLIGWAAVTGSISIEPIILFGIIFLWTPPHFWALALRRSHEYAKAGVPMLPVVKGENATKTQIVLYSLMLVSTSLVPYFIGMCTIVYFVAALILGLIFLALSINVYCSHSTKSEQYLFGYSIIYLFALFFFILLDTSFL